MEVAEDHAAAGREQAVDEVEQLDDEAIVEVVDQPDAVDEVLGRDLELAPAR